MHGLQVAALADPVVAAAVCTDLNMHGTGGGATLGHAAEWATVRRLLHALADTITQRAWHEH